MSENVGEIEYTLSVETKESVAAAKEAMRSLNSTEKSMKDTDKTAGKLNTAMNKLGLGIRKANADMSKQVTGSNMLKKALGGVLALLGTKAIIAMADQYTESSSRIKQLAKDTEEYELIQRRLIATANGTYRPLAEAQEVYIRAADAIKDLGYNTSEALDITESFSYLLVTNAASAQAGATAIDAYSAALMTGTINSERWQSILKATPTIVDDIAAATGSTRAEIKRLGVEGNLSLEALNEGLIRSKDKNKDLADAMSTTVSDAVVALKNSLQILIGSVNESTGTTDDLAAAIVSFGDVLKDPETIAAAQALALGVTNAFSLLIEKATEVLGATKFMAEGLAAAVHGPAFDDIVRMADRVETLKDRVNTLNDELDKTRLLRINPFASDEDINKEINELVAEINKYEDATRAAEKALIAQNKAASESIEVKKEEEKAAKELVKAEKLAGEEKKKQAKAEQDALKFKEKVLKAEEDNINILKSLGEAIYQTTLNADDLAARQAELMLNEYATPEQIEHAKAMAVQLRILNDQAERAKEFNGGASEFIRGDVPVLSGGAFDDGQARYDAERAEEEKRYAEQLERMKEAEELKIEVAGGYDAMREQLYQEHSDRMAEIDRVRLEMQLTQWSSGFKNMASDLKNFSETFGVENKKVAAVMKVTAISGAIIDTYKAANAAYAAMAGIPVVGPGLGIAAAATATASGMANVAQIKSQSVSGGRLYGGQVSKAGTYRVNEDGRPEIFKGADGSQYLMPNQRGEVISNKDATGGTNVTVNVIESAKSSATVHQSQDNDGNTVIDVIIDDIMSGGGVSDAIGGAFGLRRQGA